MLGYRDRNRIKQDFDNWAKGINNQLNNLRKQGFDNAAQYNIDVLKADGWEIRKDKNGNDVVSRAGANKEKYKEETYDTAKAKRESLVGVKEAKTMQPEEREQKTPTSKQNDKPEDVEDWDEGDNDYIGDEFDLAGDFYELAQILAKAIQDISDDEYDIYGALNVLKNTQGSNLAPYKALARDYISNLRSLHGEGLDEYYNDDF